MGHDGGADLIRERVAELRSAGATVVREEVYADGPMVELGHVVMLDPEGNEFCVA